MTGKQTLKEKQTEQARGRKRYLERIQEEKEAKQEQEESLKDLERDSSRGFYEDRN